MKKDGKPEPVFRKKEDLVPPSVCVFLGLGDV